MGKIVSRMPPVVRQSALSWHASRCLLPRLRWVSMVRGWLTIWDSFGTPGDTISAGTIARNVKSHYPNLRINVITPNPELLEFDPHIDRLNAPPTRLLLRFWYLDLIERKDGRTNLLAPTLAQAGVREFTYRARYYLDDRERELARQRLGSVTKPMITFNVQSREAVKIWPVERWQQLVRALADRFDLVQLGGNDEPGFDSVTRLAGRISMRESAAVLAEARVHVGGVSFLMHVANGVDVPAVIIYGGRETPANSGYAENINLAASPPCSPCWLHTSRGDQCPHDMQCMKEISVDEVLSAVKRICPF